MNARRRLSRRTWLLPVAGVALAVLAVTLWGQRLPKRFGIVAEGRLYRCGYVGADHLATLKQRYGIRTVLSLLAADAPETTAERRAARELGLRWINVPLRGDGSSTAAQRDEIRRVILDEQLAPLLVHCAAGVNRTGLAVGMYRIWHDGWTVEQVLTEMRSCGFEDLPKHENLRAALRSEWQAAHAAGAASRPGGD